MSAHTSLAVAMNEHRHIRMELKAVLAKMHAADAQAAESWQRLRSRHGGLLLATLGATGGAVAWWQWRRHRDADAVMGAPSPIRPATTPWWLLLLQTLPGLMSGPAMQVLPSPWREWVGHPWARIALSALLGRVAALRKKGAH